MRGLAPISPRVRIALNALAGRMARRGLRLFVFGSAAPDWPQAPAGADLDLGYELAGVLPADRAAVRREFLRALDELPTIRPIDAVDFNAAPEEFRRLAGAAIRSLPDESP